jgi:murein DD-endopeptidase MepM/ murein hydrolase activator NlpD
MPLRRLPLVCAITCALGIVPLAALASEIVVAPGDSLWSLARAHDTSVAELMAANDLRDERLSLGQVLRLPASTASVVYTVRPNDTLYDIARHHGVSIAAIQAANTLTDTTIRPGQQLTIVGGSTVSAPAEAAAEATPEATAEAAAAESPAEPAPEPAPEAAVNEPAPAVAEGEPVAAGAADAAVATNTATSDTHEAAAPSGAALSYTVRPTDTLYDIARAHGVSVDDLIAWNDLDGTLIRPGQVLSLTRAADGPEPQPLVVTIGPGDHLWALARAFDTTVAAIASANAIDAQATLHLGQTLIIPGRYAAVTGIDGSPPAVGGPAASEVTVGPGESLWTIARRHQTTVGALMELNGLASDRLQIGQALRVLPGGAPSQALPAAAAPQAAVPSSGMVWPLVGNITSRFGYRRLRVGGTNMHYGVDIDGNTGDPIRSATAGTVTFSGWRGGFGYLVIVTNGDTEYFYAHASELLVTEGQHVQPGDLIARVGTTGNVTGAHLHFEIRVDGTPIDPLPILEARATR